MTYAPASLRSVQALWTGQGGVNLGIVGDLAHQARGVSYHLGRDQLTSTAYSRRTARDIAGLTRAASAIDLGRLDGSLVGLRNFSTWLVGQGRSNAPGTADIREIIYSPDGKTVLRWDRERGHTSLPRKGEADSSHLTHTHISWYRDSEYRDRTVAIRPFFGLPSLPDTSTEVPVSIAFEPVDEPVRAGIFRARRTGDTIVTYPSTATRGAVRWRSGRSGMGWAATP